MSGRRLYGAIAAVAALVYVAVLWHGFVLDDLSIILANPVVHSLSGVWQAFGTSYFPSNIDVSAYRPLTVNEAGKKHLPFGVYGEVVEPGTVVLGDRVEVVEQNNWGQTPAGVRPQTA